MLNTILSSMPDTLGAGFAELDTTIAQTYGGMNYSEATFMGVPVFEPTSLMHLLMRFSFNLLVCWIIIQFFYYRRSKRRDYYLTFILFSSTMFLLLFLLKNVNMQIGITLGLFAIFGIIRYRTETVPIREMTYLFVLIGISVINGLAMTVSYAELVMTNLLMILIIMVLENKKAFYQTTTKLILYEKIDLIVPEKRDELIMDLKKRTGLEITKVEIGYIDFLRDVANLKIHYIVGKEGYSSIEHITKIKDFDHNL